MEDFILVEKLISNSLENEINNESLIRLYFDIGRVLQDKKDLYSLELYLKNKYGIVIGFTSRNFKNMILFYEFYNDVDFKQLVNIAWKNHMEILKTNNKMKFISICNKYNLDKNQLLIYIKNEFPLSYNHQSIRDEMLIELKRLKNTFGIK